SLGSCLTTMLHLVPLLRSQFRPAPGCVVVSSCWHWNFRCLPGADHAPTLARPWADRPPTAGRLTPTDDLLIPTDSDAVAPRRSGRGEPCRRPRQVADNAVDRPGGGCH